MSDHLLDIEAQQETIFFSHHQGKLCQWILVTIANRLDRTVPGVVTIAAGGLETPTQLAITPGVREYRCYAPLLWPYLAAEAAAPLQLAVAGQVITATAPVGHHRPWTIYLLSDVCTDMTWVYGNVESVRADDAETMDAELSLAESSRSAPPADRNHYNMVHAREFEFYIERYPRRTGRLVEHLRAGAITFNPFFNMASTGNMSLEELVRQFYPARAWALKYGLEMRFANHQETPAITWGMATVLAGCSIDHLVKSILPYECPWAKRLEEPPVFLWEGPDGSRILVRRRNEDYVEGNFVLRDVRATNKALHDRIIPSYEVLGASCPYDVIALVGCYGDLEPGSKQKGAKKAATIAAYNAQGWDYPRLVNAGHQQYWDHLDSQVAERRLELPVFRGDYGTGWEAWPACLALDFAGWRRAQQRSAIADRLAAIASRLDQGWYREHYSELADGWLNLISLADHAWNGANEANLILNARLRHEWQAAANAAFDGVIDAGLATLVGRVPAGEGQSILVFNSQGWRHTGVTRVPGISAPATIVDVASGEPVPAQFAQEDGQSVLYFEARALPPVGYRVYAVQSGATPAPPAPQLWQIAAGRLEGSLYAVEVSPITGAITSLYDKARGKELVDPHSPYHLNQCLYLSEGVEHTPHTASVEMGPCGPVFAQLIVRAALKNTTVVTTITLYSGLDRVDLRNEVDKLPTSERQELDFAFPFQVPDRQYRYEAPGAIITPGTDQRPGAGQAFTAVQHFVDVFNAEYGVILSTVDSGLVEFGHRTTTEDPVALDLSNSTVLAVALDNYLDWDEAVRDQAGVGHFVFRYSLRGHRGGFDPVAAVQFGGESNCELLPAILPGGQSGGLPAGSHGFVTVEPQNAILVSLKVGEEPGLIARLWECAGQGVTATIAVAGLGRLTAGCKTDLLERERAPLAPENGRLSVPLRARSLAAARLTLSD